jgi:hypothetical protein
MIVLRFIGTVFLLLAVVAATADLTRAHQQQLAHTTFTSIGKHWEDLAPQSLKAARTTVQTKVSSFVWDPLISSVIGLPAWVSFGGLGRFCLYVGRRRRRIDIYAN